MASTVHYKFKSQKDYDSIGFDGMFISVGDLKRQITERRGLGSDRSMDLVLTNAQNDEEYADDATMVWKNTSVIVKRVPVCASTRWAARLDRTRRRNGTSPRRSRSQHASTPKRPAPSAHASSMTWTADQGIRPAESADASMPPWSTTPARRGSRLRPAAGGGRGPRHGGRGGGRSRRTRRRGHGPHPDTSASMLIPGHWIRCPTNGDVALR